MDCNKDEAIRAKQIAEKKMENNNFEGARKLILKAQNLYPELENVTQLLSVCDVHCSSQTRMLGSDKDWYGILQVEKLVDELTVKKQYRRLALLLHPDKNRFPGAEAAFKLICEANAVLSDPAKKSLYDSRIRAPLRYAPGNLPPHQMNTNSQFNKQFGAQNNFPHGFKNQHQATQSSASVRQGLFWTSCPFCGIKYQCERKHVNTSLRCYKCSKSFTASETSAQDVPLASKCAPPSAQQVPEGASQSAAFQEKEVPNQSNFTTGVQNDKESAAKVGGDAKAKETYNSRVNTSHGVKEGVTCNGGAKIREARDLKIKIKKRGEKRARKRVMDSGESYDSSSECDLEDVNSGPSHVHSRRRSSRKKQNVSYNEGDCGDYIPSSSKIPQGSKLSEDNGHEQKDALDGECSKNESQNGLPTDKEMGTVHPKEVKARREAGFMSKPGVKVINVDSDIDDRDSFSRVSDENFCYDDPEFNDFDKGRDETCFAVDQIWACYDPLEGMPRYYAKVRKVFASPFALRITWLEADSVDEAQKKWIDAELPVGCGSFKLQKTQQTLERPTFSHRMHFEKGKKRGSLVIYPREGEVWALFKQWDLSWSSDPENHQVHKYEIVEVIWDFVADAGIKVRYLDKVGGFVSLFQRRSRSEKDSFLIGPNELYKFSHRIPFFKMTGSERAGVPVGSFELDPASLPPKHDL